MSTSERIGPQAAPVHGPAAAESDRERTVNAIHDRLASHCPVIEASHPEALRFGALMLATVAACLHNAVTALAESWGYKREHLSQWLRGDWERSGLPLKVVWLILTSRTKECREAARGILRLLADYLGYDVTPRQGGVTELRALAPRVYREGGDLAAAIDEAASDGRITTDERADLEQLLRARDEVTASIRASLAAAVEGRR